MATPMTVFNPAPTGLTAQYFGAKGSTDRYYWVQAIYPSGKSLLVGAPKVTTGGLDNNNRVSVEWNAMAGAIGYNVFYTTTSTPPTSGAGIFMGTVTYPTFVDNGIVAAAGLSNFVIIDGLCTARARYDFAIDGDPLAPGLITLANSDTIPKGAIMLGGYIYTPTNLAGATNVIVGISAGGSNASLHASATIATYNGLIVPVVPTWAVPVRTTAAGTITITSTVAALTAGVMDIQVVYMMPISNP